MPSDAPSTQELIESLAEGGPFGRGSVVDGPMGIDQMAEALRGNVHPDFETLMVSESARPQEFRGIEGFKEALNDWISPYESFRLEIEDVIVKEDRLVFLARQVGTTKHGHVEVETESTSVWWIEEGLISRTGFYLDRLAGLKAAGLDPDRPSGG